MAFWDDWQKQYAPAKVVVQPQVKVAQLPQAQTITMAKPVTQPQITMAKPIVQPQVKMAQLPQAQTIAPPKPVAQPVKQYSPLPSLNMTQPTTAVSTPVSTYKIPAIVEETQAQVDFAKKLQPKEYKSPLPAFSQDSNLKTFSSPSVSGDAEPGKNQQKFDETTKSFVQGIASPFLRTGETLYRATAAGGKILSALSTPNPDEYNKNLQEASAIINAPARHILFGDVSPIRQNTGGVKGAVSQLSDAAGIGIEAAANFLGAEGAGAAVENVATKTLKQVIIKLAQNQTLPGALFGLGQSLQEGSNIPDTVKNMATSALFMTLLGTILKGKTFYNLSKAEIISIKNKFIEELVSNGYTREEATKLLTQGGYAKNPFADSAFDVPKNIDAAKYEHWSVTAQDAYKKFAQVSKAWKDMPEDWEQLKRTEAGKKLQVALEDVSKEQDTGINEVFDMFKERFDSGTKVKTGRSPGRQLLDLQAQKPAVAPLEQKPLNLTPKRDILSRPADMPVTPEQRATALAQERANTTQKMEIPKPTDTALPPLNRSQSSELESLKPRTLPEPAAKKKLPIIDKSEKSVSLEKPSIKPTKNQVELNITGTTEKQRVQSAIVNSERIKNELSIRGKEAAALGQKLSPADLKLAESYEQPQVSIEELAKQAKDPKKFTAFMTKMADYYDFRLAADRAAGGSTNMVKNYIPHTWDLSSPADLEKFNTIAKQRGIQTYDGFHAQPRIFASYAEGEALGFKRQNPNILGDLKQDYGAASNVISKQVLKQGLYEASPNNVSLRGLGRTAEGKPFVNSNIRGLEGISYHPSVDKMLKGYQPLTNQDVFSLMKDKGFDISKPSTYSKAWDGLKEGGVLNTVGTLYDRANKGMKHFLLNFSGFHSINVSANYAGASIFDPISGVKGLSTSVPSFFSEKVTSNIINGFKEKLVTGQDFSVFDAGLRSGVNMDRALPAVGFKRLNPLNSLSRAMFDRELYTLKLNLVDQVFGSGKVLPESVKGRALAQEINQIMGEMNGHTMNINPNTQKWFSRVLLAPQFTESKYKVIGDALSKGAGAGNLARKAILGKSLVMGTLATLGTLLATGKYPSLHQILLNYTIAPDTQTNLINPKGQKQDVSWPQTFVSEPGKPIGGLLNGSTDELTHYAQARLAPAASDALAVYSGKDYYGNPIIDPNSKDSKATQYAKNIGLGDLPIGVQNVVKQTQGKQTTPQTLINIGGLRTHISPDDPTAKKYKQIDDAVKAVASINGGDPQRKEKIQAIYNNLTAEQRKSLNFQELLAGVNTKGIYISDAEVKMRPVYDKIQQLKASGDLAGVDALVAKMTPEDKKMYTKVKQSDHAGHTLILRGYLKQNSKEAVTYLRSLPLDEQQRIGGVLTADEKKTYAQLKLK